MKWELPGWVSGNHSWFIDLGPGAPGGEAVWARATWPDVRILGLEPCRARYQECLPTYPGDLLPVAAWDHDADALPFFASPRDNLWGLFAPERIPATEVVAARSLDSLDRERGPFDRVILWADIEGSELCMLRGAEGLLASGRILAMNLEVRPIPYAEGWCAEEEVDAYLARFGYGRARDYAERGRGHHYDVIYFRR